MRNKRFAESIVTHRKEVEELKAAKDASDKHVEQLKLALHQAESKKEEYFSLFHLRSLLFLIILLRVHLVQQSVAVRSARETALLNQNVSLQAKCGNLETEQAKLVEKTTTQAEAIHKLEAQIAELKIMAASVDKDAEVKAKNVGSPERKLEALTIRSEVTFH